MGGMRWGIGAAFHAATWPEARADPYINDTLGGELPINANIKSAEVCVVPETNQSTILSGDWKSRKCGILAAITNAHHSAELRIRTSPVRIESLIA